MTLMEAPALESGSVMRIDCVVAIMSMLHEPAESNSATRTFLGIPVLQATLGRLTVAARVGSAVVLCWDDQADAVGPIAERAGARLISKGPRIALSYLEAITAARRWTDGWRGGLLGTCGFDLGFHGPFVLEAAKDLGADGVLLIDPAAGLLDPALLDATIEHADAHPEPEIYFAPTPPGVCGPLLRMPLLERLAAARQHPGRLLHYSPDVISREPLAGDSCVPVPTPVARAAHRLSLDSDRQIARIAAAVEPLNGELAGAPAELLVQRMRDANGPDPLPREVVLELNTARLSRPMFWPGRHLDIRRPDLPIKLARDLFKQLAALDDTRLTLAGVGDPLLASNVFDVIDAARAAGLAVHLETDLLGRNLEVVRRLAGSAIDVVSVHLPAVRPETYAATMGTDGYRRALEHVHAFVAERAARGRGVPVLAPLFTKCRNNLAEMEAWYDQWLRAVGSAVIVGPSDFAGQIPDHAVADMAPPLRRPCARLASRMTILSDSRIVSCEQDVMGRQTLGRLGEDSIETVWQQQFGMVREEHCKGQWQSRPLCAGCREWHR
jgi:hypothetical protein